MRGILRLCLVLAFVVFATCAFAQTFAQHTYAGDETNFANPERGYYHHTEVRSSSYSALNENTLRGYRNEGITLIIRVFYLDLFTSSAISNQFLADITQDFATARKAGVKIITRFAYTSKSSAPYGDATPAQVLQHIEQLKPVLRANSDVIAVVQAGFIGAWGEWYYTDFFSIHVGSPNAADWVNRRTVVNALLAALPSTRSVQVRTPAIKRTLVESTVALTSGEAYEPTAKARIAHHNDCFLASPDDYGTYLNQTEEKAYLEVETNFLAMGGETCGEYVPLSECPNALEQMKRFHWSFLNRDYHPDVIGGFITNGCNDEIQKQLGYRYRLTKSNLQDKSKPGGGVSFDIAVVNDGWANVFNPRLMEVVLKNNATGKIYRALAQTDPRKWVMGDTTKLTITAGLPETMETSVYSAFINLPDPELSLRKDPQYSIRLANNGAWDAATGWNNLNHTLTVDAAASVPDYTGDNFFLSNENPPVTLSTPTELKNTVYGNNIILYWGLKGSDPYRVIERSDNGGSFETVATLPGELFSFVDNALTANHNYSYRSYLNNGEALSPVTAELNIATEATTPVYYKHLSDGVIDEWEAVKPVASVFGHSDTHALRLFADGDSLFVYAEGGGYSSYRLFLDTDYSSSGISVSNWSTATGFDYMLRNDSLHEAQSSAWVFKSKVKRKQTGLITESSVPLNKFSNLGQNFLLRVAATAVFASDGNVYLPLAGDEPALFVRGLVPVVLENFKVSPSPNRPETQLIVSWASCAGCRGYVLERSTSATNGFEVIATATKNNYIYYDNTVVTGTTYYYRAASYNEIGLSTYTPVLSGKADVATGLVNIDEEVTVFPNPIHNEFTVRGNFTQVALYDLQGRQLFIDPSTQIASEKTYHTSLVAGVYILKISTKSGVRVVRVVER